MGDSEQKFCLLPGPLKLLSSPRRPHPMSPFLHALNIITLATWLSVAGFGTVGIVVPATVESFATNEKPRNPFAALEATVLTEDFTLGEIPPSQATDTGTTGQAAEIEVPFADQETLPTPPEMPDVAEITPLPEIPDLSAPIPQPTAPAAPTSTRPRPVPAPNSKPPARSIMPTSATGGSPQGKQAATGTTGNGGRGGGSGMSAAKRLAGGRMPAPSYPSAARARGQTGTVLVEFVVGENGSVVYAYAKSPSPWPILNEQAVSAVRGWKFPPGGIVKYTRPIVFKLN